MHDVGFPDIGKVGIPVTPQLVSRSFRFARLIQCFPRLDMVSGYDAFFGVNLGVILFSCDASWFGSGIGNVLVKDVSKRNDRPSSR